MHRCWLLLMVLAITQSLSGVDLLTHPALGMSVQQGNSKQRPVASRPIPSMKDGNELPPLPDPEKPDYNYDVLPQKKPNQVEPVYPKASIDANEQGRVILHVFLDSFGDVIDVKVHKSCGYKRLDEAALAAVKQWHYSPARRGSLATPSEILVPIRFIIREQG